MERLRKNRKSDIDVEMVFDVLFRFESFGGLCSL